MDITKLFEKAPPREPLLTLATLVRDWNWRTAPGGGLDLRRDAVVAYTGEAKNFRQAVYRAVASRDRNGKMHNHQTKVPELIRQEFGGRIVGVWQYDWPNRSPRSFDGLYDALVELRPKGIGPVTTYDVAVRLGAWLGLRPGSLYLHAGVRQGWEALWGPELRHRHLRGCFRVGRYNWPKELQEMDADDLEDFLCTYRAVFPSIEFDKK